MTKQKIKVIITYRANNVDKDIEKFLSSEEAQNINIISVNGVSEEEYIITYILYEIKETFSLNS